MQDLPHRGGRDRVAELDELALHPPVPPGRIVRRDADHELPDFGCSGRSSGPPPAGVVPFAGDQPRCQASSVAGVTAKTSPHRRRGMSRDSAASHSRSGLVADPADLAAQHRVLVPEHQELGVPGRLAPGQHHQAVEQAAREQVDREDHSVITQPASLARPDRVIEPDTHRRHRPP